MWALVAVRSLKGNYFSESNEASLHLDRKRVTATQHNTARGQRVSGESEETWFGARRHRKRGTNLILKESASALLIQGLPVIWVTCCPKVAASLDRPDYRFTHLAHISLKDPAHTFGGTGPFRPRCWVESLSAVMSVWLPDSDLGEEDRSADDESVVRIMGRGDDCNLEEVARVRNSEHYTEFGISWECRKLMYNDWILWHNNTWGMASVTMSNLWQYPNT